MHMYSIGDTIQNITFNAFYVKNTKMTSSGENGLCRNLLLHWFGHLKCTSSESITCYIIIDLLVTEYTTDNLQSFFYTMQTKNYDWRVNPHAFFLAHSHL